MGFLASIRTALPALFIAVAAAGLAWLALKMGVGTAVVVTLAIAALGGFNRVMGSQELSRTPPRAISAIRFFEWGVLGPASVAAAAGAVAIYVAIDRTTDTTSPETKALITAAVTAVSTFLTTSFVKWSDDTDDKMVSKWVESKFGSRFKGVFEPGSDSQLAAQDPARYDGWGRAARRKRAKIIEARWDTDRV